MKRKLVSIAISLVLVFTMSASVFADSNTIVDTDIEYLPDGSYYETVTTETVPLFTAYSTTSTLTGTKTMNYKNGAGAILWTFTVTGKFSYNGSSSSCTSASVTASAPHATWSIASKSSSKSGNKASASATAKKYLDGSVVQTVSQTITLTCSANGTLS
jgi:hypothetical protein